VLGLSVLAPRDVLGIEPSGVRRRGRAAARPPRRLGTGRCLSPGGRIDSPPSMSVRAAVRTLLETGLVWSGGAALRRSALVRRSLVLAYHNVVPDGSVGFGDGPLHLPRRAFVRQVEYLLRSHAVVPLDEVFTPAPPGRRPRVAITFDDAYRGAVAIGVEELARRGVPATLFVVPSFAGKGPFWWDAVAGERGGADSTLRHRALHELAGQDAAVRGWAEAQGLRPRAV